MALGRGPWAWPWLLLLLSGSLGRSPPSCPPSSPCFCFWAPDTVQCRFVRLEGPPESVPRAAESLSIVGARLSGLGRAAFAGGWLPGSGPRRPLANLTLLLLSHDGLERLEEGAFAGLPALATLDLSHNPLRAIHPSAFGLGCCRRLATLRLNQALGGSDAEALLDGALLNLSSLARLELRGNGLRDPPPAWSLPPGLEELDLRNNSIVAWKAERLDGLLLALPRLRLQVAPNPSQCDCPSLRPLLAWHRNASWRTPDAPELRCASPARLKESPLRRLRPLQLGCRQEEEAGHWGLLEPQPPGGQDPELETASYVFFGIVLALIGVVFLMVLYLNRRGIKRWLNNLREACRDQMEGYHYRYEQDSDPRRASPGEL
ncbi:trophoblast glycoprotein-like [Sceloporus undulatus]|uniref:trophoblast glycoprotein-like n=1 Tax=Sceloporus undulatus TaxID=8520 RepID=UPI001C4D87DD|nr:trophoblast glycoprotein-like [Sceloporus undulatus]